MRSRAIAAPFAIVVMLAAVVPAVAAAKLMPRMPAPELLGIRLGMPERQARTRLLRIGKPSEDTEGSQETWSLRDRRYGSLAMGFDSEGNVSWVTAVARPRGARVRFRDLGDPSRAHRSGNYIYTWDVSARDHPCAFTARGSDSTYVSSVSLHAPGPSPAP